MENLIVPYINGLLGVFVLLVMSLLGLMISDWLSERRSEQFTSAGLAPEATRATAVKRSTQTTTPRRRANSAKAKTSKAA